MPKHGLIFIGVLATALTAAQCGSGSQSSPASPSQTGGAIVTIAIVGTQGNRSYVPNPVPVAAGEQVVFRNNDVVDHRIVMDNGSGDSGTLPPGGSSPSRTVTSGSFHCTIHPSMVGSINTPSAPEPPPGSGDGY